MQNSLSLLEVRQSLNLTQVQMADMLDITPEYVSMIENNKKKTSAKLLNKLGLILEQSEKRPSSVTVSAACPMCTAKDKELYQSRKIIEIQAKTISDLTSIVKSLKEDNNLNEPAARASGAATGLNNAEKKAAQ